MFHIVDIDLDPPKPNVLGQHFEVEEGTFLAGYLAAALSRTGKVGTLGGMQIPPVTAYMDGFARGVDYYNQQKAGDVQVLGWDLAAQTGAFVGDFADRDGYKNKAAELIGAGVDILMPVGPPGNGAEIAAKEAGNVMLIGVDSDWYEALPEYREIMLTSVMKNIDVLTYKAIQSMVEGSFAGGTLVGSLKNVGVSLAPFHELEDRVPAVLRAEINKIKAGINTGSIPEPDPASIEGKPPDFEDDFASRRPEWRLDDRGSKIAGGSMVLVVEENGQGANAGGDHLNATDFVLEFDFQRTSQDCIDCAIVIWYRGNDQSSYGLDLSLGPGALRWQLVKVQDGIKEEFHQGDIPRVDPPASHHFRLVAQGDAFRFYLDQELVTYWQEAALTGSSIGIGSRNLGGTSWIQIDNLKLWSLDPAWPKEIRNRPPDFEDDFSPPKEEWKLMGLSDELNIEDYVTEGVLRLGPEARQLNAPTLTAANFVIEFDFLPPTDAVYKFGFRFRGEADGRDYSLYFWERDWGLLLTYPAQQDWPALTEGRDSPEIVPGQWTHVLLIVQGDQYTLYLNGKPVGYIRDDTLHGDQNDFNFAEGSKTLDNVKFWSLDPAWAKEIPNRPPDFEDDFSSLKPDWKKERYIGGFGVTEGVLRLSKNALVGEHSLQALDYVFQTDLRLNEITENMMILCSLRLTEYEGGKYGTEYQVHIYPWEKYWEIFVIKVPRGQWEPVKEGELQAFKPGQWIHLTIAISGDSVRIYWDDELLVEDQGLELTGEMNQIGVFTESDTFRLDLDNWKFWKLE